MRNTQYPPNKEVPIELRLETYKEAIEFIKQKKSFPGLDFNFLCGLLPCIFWGYKEYSRFLPNNKTWLLRNTVIMFPELDKFLTKGFNGKYTDYQRIKFLRATVYEIEQQLNQK